MDTTSFSPQRVAIDDLDRAIVSISARINVATYELLVLIRQFDERAGWLKWGFMHCADWLHWRCDLSLNAARRRRWPRPIVHTPGARSRCDAIPSAAP